MTDMDITAALNVITQVCDNTATTRLNHEVIQKALEIIKKKCA